MITLTAKNTVTKFYSGNQQSAYRMYLADKEKMSSRGYRPASETWQPGSWGVGAFIVALLLCFILIGILVFIYMIIVKPAGKLVVTYERQSSTYERQSTAIVAPSISRRERECPYCAELILEKANVCKHCGREVEAFYETDAIKIDPRDINKLINDRDDTLLIAAAREGNTALVKRLVDLGAKKDIENMWGLTALKAADKAGNKMIVRMLSSD